MYPQLTFHLAPTSSTNFRYHAQTPDHSHLVEVERTASKLWSVAIIAQTPTSTPGIYTPALTPVRKEYKTTRNAAFTEAEYLVRDIQAARA